MEIKAVIFDFDGTLTRDSKGETSWYGIWKELNDLKTDRKFLDMFNRGEIDNRQWFDLICARYIKKGVNNDIFITLSSRVKLIEGIDEVFKLLTNNGVKIYVLSGGVKPIIKLVLAPYEKYITRIEAYDFIFDVSGKLVDMIYPPHDLENKNNFVNIVKDMLDIKPHEILFVGNGSNDETVFKAGVKTLCINPTTPNYKNEKLWNNYIKNCENLKEILNYCK